jgi:O-antigen/teichoic acid export membrane protein
MRRFVLDIIIVCLLFLLPLAFFLPQTLGGRTLIPTENLFQYEPYATYREQVGAPEIPHNHLVSDLILENYQWKSFIRQQLAQGEVPLWNPYQFSGIPFLAAGQHSALYPISIIYYVLPLWLAYGWFTVINLWLAGVFMYLFARGLGSSRTGAMLAAVVYQFGGFVLASVVFQMMIGALPWLPLMLLMAEYIIREKELFGRKTAIPWVAIGAAALGMNILAGHVEVTLYSLIITGYYAGIRWLVNWWRTRDNWATLKTAAWLLTMVVLGIGLAAIQFFPLVEFANTNWRSERSSIETVLSYAHPKRDILQFIMPNFYGNPTHHQVFDVFDFTWHTDFGSQTHTDWGIKNYVEGAVYLGILPLLLAVYAVGDAVLNWNIRRGMARHVPTMVSDFPSPPSPLSHKGRGEGHEPPYRVIFASLGLISLTFMFGLPTYRLLFALPGFNQLNSPFRWIFALTVCVAILAAFGLDALLRRASEKPAQLETRIGYGIMAVAVLILLGLGASYISYPSLENTIASVMNSLAKANQAFSNTRLFYSYQFVNVLIFAVMLLLSGLAFAWIGKMRQSQGLRQWSIFVVGLVVVDLWIASWGFNPASDPKLLEFTPPAIQWLIDRSEEEGIFRYITLESPATPHLMNANVTMQYGLYDVRGYDSIIPRQYVDYMREFAPQVQLDYNRIAPLYTNYSEDQNFHYTDAFENFLFDYLAIRYVITGRSTEFISDRFLSRPVYEDDAVRIWRFNYDTTSYAYLYPSSENDEDFVLSGNWQALRSGLDDAVRQQTVYNHTGREKFLNVSVESEHWLIISENYALGWKAFIRPLGTSESDEQQLPVERVLGTFQGVQLPVGDWTVRLVYSPQSVQVGFFGSAITAITITLLVGMWLWRVFVGVNTAESSQSAKVARNSIAPIILNLFNRGIDFVLAIVIYRLLSQEMVGVYNFAIVVFVWFDIFTNFGLDLFLMREVSRDKAQSGYYLFNTSVLRLWLSMLGFGLLGAFLMFWQRGVSEPLPSAGIIAMLLLYVGLFPASLSKGMTSLYYAHEQAEKPAAIATITSINKAVFGVIVLLLGWGIVGLAGVSIINNLITLGVLYWAGRNLIGELPKVPNRLLIRDMVNESYPLLLNHFLATIFFQIDIVILQAMRGAVLVAQYSTAYKWLLAINIVPAFFTQALFPVLSRQAKEDTAKFRRTYTFGLKLMLALALPLAVVFTLLATPLTLILAGESYLPNGAIALMIMIWSIPLGWMNSLTQYALIALDLQRYITRAFIVAVLFNIITNIIFIPIYSFQAAAVTTIFSELVLLIPFLWLINRGIGQRMNWFSLIWRPVVATLAMGLVAFALGVVNVLLALVVASAVYALVLLALKPLDENELAILRPMLPTRVRQLAIFNAKTQRL